MGLIVLGVLLWSFAHLFKRLLPEARARMGNAARPFVALSSFAAIALMVFGYRQADVAPLWHYDWAIHVNNLLMVIAVVLMGVGSSTSRLRTMLRHPMLTGALVWAVAHLLVNGDLPSLVLFGGIGLWAIVQMIAINRAEPEYVPFDAPTRAGDIRLFVISLAVLVVIILIHGWIGPSPLPG